MQWWGADKEYLQGLKCNPEDILKVLNRSLALLPYPVTVWFLNVMIHCLIDISHAALLCMYTPQHESKLSSSLYNFSSYAEDAVMALAFALNATINTTNSTSVNATQLTEFLANVTFDGATVSND